MAQRQTVRIVGVTVALVLFAFTGALAAAGTDDEPKSPLERLSRDLLGIQNNLTNAKVKVRHGMGGVPHVNGSDEEAQEQRPPTPAEACCSSNIERIQKKLGQIRRDVEQLDLYYADRNNAEALNLLNEIRGHSNTVAQGVAVFKMAGTVGRANQAMVGLIRPFNHLREAIERLQACCPVDAAAFSGGKAAKQP